MGENIYRIVGVILLAVVFGFIITLPVMLVWNGIIPTIFGLPTITFWQSFGLMFLANVFFKNTASNSQK